MSKRYVNPVVLLLGVTALHAIAPVAGKEMKIVVPNIYERAEGKQEGFTGWEFPMKAQVVFPASEFVSLPDAYRWITALAIRPDQNAILPRTTEFADAQYRMSTTDRGPNELSDTFAENVGPDETIVMDRPLTISADEIDDPLSLGPRNFDYIFEFQTPFLYNPRKGNLLLEFRSRSGWLIESPHYDTHDLYGEAGLFAPDPEAEEATSHYFPGVYRFTFVPMLQPGDADQDLDFDQLDLVKVQVAAQYLSDQAATWGDGDWNGAPGGYPGKPPAGDGRFNQLDIVAALSSGQYLNGPYAATRQPGWEFGDLATVSASAYADQLHPAGLLRTAGPATSQSLLMAQATNDNPLAHAGGATRLGLIYVPEPSSLLLVTIGLLMLFMAGWRAGAWSPTVG